jgi:hypothetical protein
MVRGGARLLIEIIKGLSGNNVPRPNQKGHYERMKGILQYLMSQGAHLSCIKPEFLLSKSNFSSFYRKKIIKSLLGLETFGDGEIDYELVNGYTSTQLFSTALITRLTIVEKLFPLVSWHSWVFLVLQILKIYLEPKFKPDSLAHVPGVSAALTSLKESIASQETFASINRSRKFVFGSNVCNPVESSLLKWITIHYCKMNKDRPVIFTNFTELRDPQVLLSLFKSHLPRVNLPMVDDAKANMRGIIDLMNQYHIPLSPDPGELLEGSAPILCLLALQLYETLPHFLPVISLEWNVNLCESKAESIMIKNPSNKEITYHARIDGSSNFQLTRPSITLGPNESLPFKIDYIARSHHSELATLTLVPDKPVSTSEKLPQSARPTKSPLSVKVAKRAESTRDKPIPPTFATTIVAELSAHVRIHGPFETIEIEGPIYEIQKRAVVIKNAVKTTGTFQIISRYFHVYDEKGNQIGPKLDFDDQLRRLIEDPFADDEFPVPATPYSDFVQHHDAFTTSAKEIIFEMENESARLEIEFLPISLGTYRCFILFLGKSGGEFLYEIHAIANLPEPIPNVIQVKAESGTRLPSQISIALGNRSLFRALSMSICRRQARKNHLSERRLNDLLGFHEQELQEKFMGVVLSTTFSVSCTLAPFFELPDSATITKIQNSLRITFAPTRPGEYSGKLVLISDYDVRVLGISGSAIPAKKELAVNFSAYVGKPMIQELPFENPATTPWTFKTSLEGNPSFSVPFHFIVSPTSTYQLPVTFLSTELRECTAKLTVYNITKEATIIYRLTAIVEDPPAEATIVVTCKAREPFEKCIDVLPFIHHGRATVIVTVPVATAPSEVEFRRGSIVEPLVIKGWAPRSGITAGQLKLMDQHSSLFIWYVIEVHVDHPEPEDVIEVATTVRESATVRIPVHNPKSQQIEFEVSFAEEDFFGPKTIEIDGSETGFYLLVFSPLQVFERTSFISFVNDNEGEFVYLIHCVSLPPNLNIVAPMTAPLGKFASTFLVLENPFDRRISFTIEGDGQQCFQVISKPIFQLGPREKKQLEVRYFPSSLSDLQTSFLTLKSREVGDWFYKLSGTGKTPPPLSPSILECHPGEMTSNAIDFANPFQSTTKFEISISDQSDVFQLLSKRKIFTLPGCGDIDRKSVV